MAAEGLFIVGLIIVIGLLSQLIFRRFHIPDALLLIAFGAFLSFTGVVDSIRQGSTELSFLITFSLIYVVFYGALPIRLKAIFSTMKFAFLDALMNFIAITALLGFVSYLMGFGWVIGLCIGALFSVLDGSIINGLLGTIKVSESAKAQIQTESAIIDIIVIVGVLSFLNFASMTAGQIVGSLSSYLFLSLGIGLVAAFAWVFLLRYVGNYSSTPIATMALLVMIYAFAEFVMANGVVAVFTFSIVLGNVSTWSKLLYKKQQEDVSVLSSSAKGFFRDISFLVRTFLFVYLGIMVDFSQWGFLLIGLAFLLVALTVLYRDA
jgi:cell volume regulation protein A